MSVADEYGYRTSKLASGTTSEYGRYVKSLGDSVTGSLYVLSSTRAAVMEDIRDSGYWPTTFISKASPE